MGSNQFRRGDEPIPGYQLVDYLGQGGFGEVWQATGPGGVQVALKFIHDLDRKKGGKELTALQLLKNIRHPNLVPLLGFWLKSIDGTLLRQPGDSTPSVTDEAEAARGTMQPAVATVRATESSSLPAELVIAMGLCETSLFDRLEECRAEETRGVPSDELLTYMEDAARAIDLLNIQHGIQHCDVKPQNILLLSGAAQVADFGLATTIGDVRESSMGAGTIAYGAPEVLLGQGPTSATDQYSLAISYFELRTGDLPFGSERISDVINAKQTGEIDLSLLPPAEARVIARAAAIEPDDRFFNCVEMVKSLREAALSPGSVAPVPIRSQRSSQQKWAYYGATAVALLLAAGLAFSFTGQREQEPAEKDAAAQVETKSDDLIAASAETTTETPGPAAAADQPSSRTTNTPHGESPADLAVHSSTAEQPTAEVVSHADTASREPDVSPSSTEVVPAEDATATNQEDQQLNAAPVTADSTQEIVEATQETARNTRDIAVATESISQSLDVIRQHLAQAIDSGGLVTNPRQPSDFYHNARTYEQRGDYLNARRAYARLLSFHLNVLDPHLRYQRLLRLQDGQRATREIYAELTAPPEDLATRFAQILVLPARQRPAALQSFLSEYPNYAPAVYQLSREYSKEILGVQGLADKAEEKQLLERFTRLVDDGEFVRHFLDQSQCVAMIDDARTRLVGLQQFDTRSLDKPVQMTTLLSNTSWSVNLTVAEAAREIFYQLDPQVPYRSSGFHSFVDQRTGSQMPNPSFELALNTPRTTFWVKYVDVRGQERGPFEFVFDPEAQRVQNAKKILEKLPHAWISYRPHHGRLVAYFSHLVSYRAGIEEIRYGIDSQQLNQTFPLGPIDPVRPHTVPSDAPTYVYAPLATRFIMVQLTYRDGTKSKVQRFDYVAPPDQEQFSQNQAAEQEAAQPQYQQSQPQRQSNGRLLDNVDVDIGIDPSFRSAPRIRFGF